jgi:hypothetical protein
MLAVLIGPFWFHALLQDFYQLKSNKCEYFKEPVNYVDLLSLFLIPFLIIQSFESFNVVDIDKLRVYASVASCLIVVKVFDWLRLFGNTSFYILLMTETLYDIRYFIVLIFLCLAMFGIPMVVLNQNRSDDNSVISKTFDFWFIDMMINQYLLALGEFASLDAFE